jgi:8-oxo-dGTP pyrophosphatase MutT (NUDIX family)
MGASILPITMINGKIYFLFGKERTIDVNPGWSDFGGGSEKGESFLTTAIREGSEELTGFLGASAQIKKLLLKYGTYNIDYKSDGHTTYRVHIFPLPYDEMLTYYYNNNQQFLQAHLDTKIIEKTKIFEKEEIKWFSWEEMKKNKGIFRNFYQNIVDLLLKDKERISLFANKAFKKRKTRKQWKF